MSTLNAHLKELVGELSAELPEVTERRMFGSDAFFANANIYSIVWDGRILLRFPVEARFVGELLANGEPRLRAGGNFSARRPSSRIWTPCLRRPTAESAVFSRSAHDENQVPNTPRPRRNETWFRPEGAQHE